LKSLQGKTIRLAHQVAAYNHCNLTYGSQTDWLANLDGDEYLHIVHQNKSVHTLGSYLLQWDLVCIIEIPWTLTYHETKFLQPKGSLLETYPRECVHKTRPGKLLYQPDLGPSFHIHFGHWMEGSKVKHGLRVKHDSIMLVHYFAQSIEQWLKKMVLSKTGHPRHFKRFFASFKKDGDDETPNCTSMNPIAYHKDYYSECQHFLELTLPKEIKPFPLSKLDASKYKFGGGFYEIYLLFVEKVTKREEWNESAYLWQLQPEIIQHIGKGKTWQSGLHHFVMTGHFDGLSSHWKLPQNNTP